VRLSPLGPCSTGNQTSTSSAPSGRPLESHPVSEPPRDRQPWPAPRPAQHHLGKGGEATNGPAGRCNKAHLDSARHGGRCAGRRITVIADRIDTHGSLRHPRHTKPKQRGERGHYAREGADPAPTYQRSGSGPQGRAQRTARPLSEKAPHPTSICDHHPITGLVDLFPACLSCREEGEAGWCGSAISGEGSRGVVPSPAPPRGGPGNGHCAGGLSLSTRALRLEPLHPLTPHSPVLAGLRQGCWARE